MPFIEGMYSGFAFSLSFPDDESLKMVSHTKEEKQNYMQEMENRRHLYQAVSPFLFLHENERGIKLSGRSRGLLVSVLGGCMWG